MNRSTKYDTCGSEFSEAAQTANFPFSVFQYYQKQCIHYKILESSKAHQTMTYETYHVAKSTVSGSTRNESNILIGLLGCRKNNR